MAAYSIAAAQSTQTRAFSILELLPGKQLQLNTTSCCRVPQTIAVQEITFIGLFFVRPHSHIYLELIISFVERRNFARVTFLNGYHFKSFSIIKIDNFLTRTLRGSHR